MKFSKMNYKELLIISKSAKIKLKSDKLKEKIRNKKIFVIKDLNY